MSMKLTLAGTIVVGLMLIGCGDDDGDDVVDAGRDSGTVPDAATPDSGGTPDSGASDSGTADSGAPDAGGGAFSAALTLTTAAEVPPCAAAGAGAMGSGTITIDADDTTITVVNLTYEGLSGPATMGHIHSGAADAAGPIVFPFTDVTSPIDEAFTAADYPDPPPAGAPADFAAFVAAMRAGDTYVNIHTAACAPGEIRAQIVE